MRKGLTMFISTILIMSAMLALAGMYPGAKIIVLDEECDVMVTFVNSYAGANNEFGLHSPEHIYLGHGHSTTPGTSWNLGTFAAGVELIFYIKPGAGYTYITGPGDRNPDGVVHAAITDLSYQKWEVGFEDLWGGGDRDYNDVILTIEGCLEIQPPGEPVADFTWSPPVPNEGAVVQFIDLSTDPDDDIVSWSWTFGDEGASTVQNPIHTYGHGGDYEVTLTVTDESENSDSITKTISISNVAPVPVMTVSPSSIDEGATVTFDGYFDDPSWLDTHTALWDFGDGTTAAGTFSPGYGYSHHEMDEVTHTYGDNGLFSAVLTITDNLGDVGIASEPIIVNNVAPIVDPITSVTIDEGSSLTLEAHVTDPGSDDITIEWTWEHASWCDVITEYYNNGISPDPPLSPDVNPMDITESSSCEYGDNGDYTVTLTVTDDDLASTIMTVTITVVNLEPEVVSVETTIYTNAPRTQGYWNHQCGVTEPYGDHTGILQEWIDAIAEQSDVFSDVTTKEEVCSILNPEDRSNMLLKAKQQLMALWLNVVSGKLYWNSPLDLPDLTGAKTVGEAIEEAEHVILNIEDYSEQERVKDVADSINNFMGITEKVADITVVATDPGSDDLTFEWSFGAINTHLNDGQNPDPFPSPWGLYPFQASDNVVYGYDGSATITLNIIDDDNGMTAMALDL